jgi:predicted nucleic acid-binding protein
VVLVDTSIWIDFLRDGNDLLKEFLESGQVMVHPLIVGELSCGNISKRTSFLKLINELPQAKESSHEEVMHFIENNKLFGKGVGFVDLHILTSAIISNVPLWTGDKRLAKISRIHHTVL